MDQLGHVNNVTYVDYLQEARVDMFRVHAPVPGGEELAEGVVVVRHEVQYLHPLVFRLEPVSVEIWASEVRAATFTLAYEIFDETPEGRRVYLRARSVLTPYVFAGEHPRRLTAAEQEVLRGFLEPEEARLPAQLRLGEPVAGSYRYDCAVRFSDVDVYRHVNNVKYFEYFQEARIDMITAMGGAAGDDGGADGPLGVVVAQIDVDYRSPILFREQPYAVESWVSRVGRSSFVIDGQIRDGDVVLSAARAVMVAFDATTQRPQQLTDAQRATLLSGPA
jgi:acyl-CoA thioester hydrolase